MIRKTIQTTITGDSYQMNILLTNNVHDIGFMDVDESVTGMTITATTTYVVTGYSGSRLSELRKYTISGTLADLYLISTTPTIDGLDLIYTISGSTYRYYLGGITYIDTVSGSTTLTSFTFQSLAGNDPNNYDVFPLIKLEEKQNIIDNPVVSKDVVIVRQEIPVFEQSIRLRAVNNLNDIVVYGGGNVFTVHNNT